MNNSKSARVLHPNGDEFPSHLIVKELKAATLKHLAPYVFAKGEEAKRGEFVEKAIEYYETHTQLSLSGQTQKIVQIARKPWFEGKNVPFQALGNGFYRYVGQSADVKFERKSPHSTSNGVIRNYKADREIAAKEDGSETLYVWWHRDSEELAKLHGKSTFAMKVGLHNSPNVGSRFEQYRVAIPHSIRLGLTVSCENASRLEKALHTTLSNRGLKIGEEGSEWFRTNLDEITEILEFHHLIAKGADPSSKQ